MTVNANYKGVALPFDNFPLLDQLMSDTFAPVQELDALARQLSIAQFPGAITVLEGGVNVTIKPPRQNPGRREVIGIIDAAAAARFRLSTASLQNAGGRLREADDRRDARRRSTHAKVGADGVTRSGRPHRQGPGDLPADPAGLGGAVDQGARRTERAADGAVPVVRRRRRPGPRRRGRAAPRRATRRSTAAPARPGAGRPQGRAEGLVEPTAKPDASRPRPRPTPQTRRTHPPTAAAVPHQTWWGPPRLTRARRRRRCCTTRTRRTRCPSSRPADRRRAAGREPAGRAAGCSASSRWSRWSAGPLLMWMSQTGRGPQWLRR